MEIPKFNYYNLSHIFDYFYVIPYLNSFNKILGFYIDSIMLGVKLDVNW